MKYCPNRDCSHLEKVGKPAEYEDSATQCSDCDTALVDQMPAWEDRPQEIWDEMIPVMAIGHADLVPVLESILEEAGIRHAIHGNNVQDLFGIGRIGAGFNVAAGVPVLFVESGRADEAKELLAELED